MSVRTVSLFAAAAAGVAVVTAGLASPAHAAPILWNQLGSAEQVTNSAYGPDLSFFNTPGSPTVRDFAANPAYVPGVFGNGLSIGPGNYTALDREHNVVLDNLNQHLKADRGTIEVWYKQNQDPVGFSHGVYRIFDGSYGLGSGMTFVSEHVPNTPKGRLYFGLEFGGANTLVSHDISAHNGNWIHIAGVWDRDGIGGSADKLRLYLDGTVVAATTSAGWGSAVGPRADIGGGNDSAIAGKFALDNLKLHDTALTDFSHRFSEDGAIPEPSAGLAVIGLATGALLRRRRR